MGFGDLFSAASGGGGGGGTYGNSGSSGVSTPVTTTTGGLSQSFDLTNRAFSTSGIPTWAIVAGLALLAFWVLRK